MGRPTHALSATWALALAVAPLAGQSPTVDRAAWAGSIEVTWEELDPVLVQRFAMTAAGREVLDHMLKTRLLGKMAAERDMVVSRADVDRRIRILDDQIKLQGEPGGLQAQLAANDVDVEEFRELTRYLIIQERLCREALGLPPGSPVKGADQELWIENEMNERGLEAPAPPWKDGIAGRCGSIVVGAREYTLELRTSLPIDDVREACYQLALLEGVSARMPDLAPEALERAVDEEIARRRRNAEADPQYKGASFERLLGMQGFTIESLRRDASVRVVALSRLWVERSFDDDDLRRTYEAERASFDTRYGEAVRTHVLFLNAAVLTNQLNPRSFEEAFRELEKLRERIADLASFMALATKYSEDPASRSTGGEIGWLRRVGQKLERLRAAIFADVDSNGPLEAGGRLLGPLEVEGGAVLVWISEHHPAPGWDEMRQHVKAELRARLLEDVLPRSELVTFLDV